MRQPFPQWDSQVTDALLTESPWAHGVEVRFLQPFQTAKGSGSVPTAVNLVVRWASALPVRQATAISLGLNHKTSKRLLEVVQPAEYLIEVAGFPVSAASGGPGGLQNALQATSKLTTRGKATRPAVSAYVPEHGMHLTAEIRFPADPAIVPSDTWVEFTAEPGTMRIRSRFLLSEMLYETKLSL